LLEELRKAVATHELARASRRAVIHTTTNVAFLGDLDIHLLVTYLIRGVLRFEGAIHLINAVSRWVFFANFLQTSILGRACMTANAPII